VIAVLGNGAKIIREAQPSLLHSGCTMNVELLLFVWVAFIAIATIFGSVYHTLEINGRKRLADILFGLGVFFLLMFFLFPHLMKVARLV
jgi:hypothetical protein